MVNKLVSFVINDPYRFDPSPHFLTIGTYLRACFAFKNLQRKAHDPRFNLYDHNLILRCSSVFYLCLNQVIKNEQLDDGKLPEWYFEFGRRVGEVCYEGKSNCDYGYFIRLVNQFNDSSILIPFMPIFTDNFAITAKLGHVLNPRVDIKLSLPLNTIYDNVQGLFDHMKFVFPRIKQEFIENKPFKSDSFENYQKGLSQLSDIEVFFNRFSRLFYKKNNNTTLSQHLKEISARLVKVADPLIFDARDGKGLFHQFSVPFINYCQSLFDPEKGGVVRETIKATDVPKELRFEYLKFIAQTNVTYSELQALIDYMLKSNDLFKTTYALLYQPFPDLCSNFQAFFSNTDIQSTNTILQQDRLPRFRAESKDVDLSEIFQKHLPKNLRQIEVKIPKVEVTHQTLVSPKFENLFKTIRSCFPPFLKMGQTVSPLLNAVMFLEDLEGATRLHSTKVQCMLIWKSSHGLLQQLLQQKVLETTSTPLKDHNLSRLQKHVPGLNISSVKKLNVAHLWIDQLYGCLDRWNSYGDEIPEILSHVKKIFSNEPSIPFLGEFIEEVYKDAQTLVSQDLFNHENQPHPVNLVMSNRQFVFNVEHLMQQLNPQSEISILLMEFKKDLELLKELELELKTADTSNLPAILRYMARLHHALLQHLLRAIYASTHFVESREHNLTALVESINWSKPLYDEIKKEVETQFKNLHHLSNYPFESSKNIISPWHQALVFAELLRSSPEQLSGFKLSKSTLSLGELQLDPSNVSLETILKTVEHSKDLLISLIPLLLEELEVKIS